MGAAAVLAIFAFIGLSWLLVSVNTILVLAVIFARLVPQLSQIQQSWNNCIHALPAYQSYQALLTRVKDGKEPVLPEQKFTFDRDVSLCGVDFGYTPADETLSNITVSVPKNTTLAIVGPSGAGKSTIADIFAGLLYPRAGWLSVDGNVITDFRAWRSRVAYVSQDSFLFNSTIRDNLKWIVPQASDEELLACLEMAAADFVRVMPLGLDTTIGERGIRVSGGERQRLAIARALLARPEVIILDEATSALDSYNELLIQNTLERLHGNITLIIIAHRMSTVQFADRVVVVDKGRVIEAGAYSDLASKPGSYLAGSLA